MLEPRPEIRTATLLRSRMMSDGPVLGRVPFAGRASHGASAPAFHHGDPMTHPIRATLIAAAVLASLPAHAGDDPLAALNRRLDAIERKLQIENGDASGAGVGAETGPLRLPD